MNFSIILVNFFRSEPRDPLFLHYIAYTWHGENRLMPIFGVN